MYMFINVTKANAKANATRLTPVVYIDKCT